MSPDTLQVKTMLKIQNLQKIFPGGTAALNDVSFNVAKGEFVVILGPSGSGKTTLLNSINGLIEPTAGSILLEGQNVNFKNPAIARQYIGMIFQNFNLVTNLSVINNVLSGMLDKCHPIASLLYLFSKEQKVRALECLDQVGLLSKAYARADQLSGGQQQRVGIARAIARSPLVILADEPVASLDPMIAFQVLSLLKEISATHGITVVCNLHQVDLALRFADRIVGLSDGNVALDSPVSEINPDYIHDIYGSHGQGIFFGAQQENPVVGPNVPLVS
jgi:phosphonate transport system ATP-binding protein